MSDVAEASVSPLTEERARAILRNSPDSIATISNSPDCGNYLAEHLDRRCSCNACYVCAATFLVNLQNRLTGPTVFINGWRVGMNKVGVGKLLHKCGIPLAASFQLTNQIIGTYRRDPENENRFDDGPPIQVQVAEGIDRDEFIEKLR